MRIFAILLLALLYPSACWAGLGSYLANYRIALELRSQGTSSELSYEAPKQPVLPQTCLESTRDTNRMRCSTSVNSEASSPFGISIQQAFKRTGWFYGNFDFGASFFSLDGKTPEWDPELPRPPLHGGRMHLYGMNVKAYVEFGITPPSIVPDILLSLGIGEHFSRGNLKLDGKSYPVSITAQIYYSQLEIVWWRFKDGSLSSYVASENTDEQPVKINSEGLSHIRLSPSSYSFGILKLVLPFSTK